MLKLFILFAFFTISLPQVFSQIEQTGDYQYFVDITDVRDDKLNIELITPIISTTKLNFLMPAYTAGSYRVYNFGRFVTSLKAYDINGNQLPVDRADTNMWEISGAISLYKITYKIEDTFDDKDNGLPVFEPAGTNFDEGRNFILNNNGIFGYIEGLTKTPFRVTVFKPSGFYGSTTLHAESRSSQSDLFTAPDFFTLIDNPIMYCKPDTTTLVMDNTEILFSVYSEEGNNNISASQISLEVKKILDAHKKYIGTLPVQKYAFIMYLFSKPGRSGSAGALEHNNCSVYFMPEAVAGKTDEFMDAIRHVSAHEFFHIVTPLNLHSEEIEDMNFNTPKMSKHLWLYEGVTEYAAHLVQLREKLTSMDEFCKEMQKKMNNSERYDTELSFTNLSRGAYFAYKDQYLNVYEKGALIGFCLDVIIRESTAGAKGLMDVLRELSAKYGHQRPFKDDELFSEITQLTSPAVGDFFSKHVEGTEPLPIAKIAKLLGLEYSKERYNQIDFGEVGFDLNRYSYRFYFKDVSSPSKFARELGIEAGDEIVAVNRTKVSILNMEEVFGSPDNSFDNGDSYEMVISRFENASEHFYKLEAKVSGVRKRYAHEFSQSNNFSGEQLAFRDKWLGK